MSGREDGRRAGWDLGPALRQARETLSLSQVAVAERAGVSRTLVQSLETGRRPDGAPVRPKASTVTAVATAVGLDPRLALGLAGIDPAAYRPVRSGRPTASMAEARDLMGKLTEVQRWAVIDLLRAMVDPTGTSTGTTPEFFRSGVVVSEAEGDRKDP